MSLLAGKASWTKLAAINLHVAIGTVLVNIHFFKDLNVLLILFERGENNAVVHQHIVLDVIIQINFVSCNKVTLHVVVVTKYGFVAYVTFVISCLNNILCIERQL